jgi:parallel beta-helix repeat protein
MNKKQLLMTALSSLLLLSLLPGGQFIRLTEANFLPAQKPQPAFTILSDGSIDPPTAPIQRNGETYTLTDDIVGYTIAVERDNVVLDGGGYALQGNGNSTGVFIRNQNGVTVRNMKIRNHFRGIWLLTDVYIEEITGNHIVSGNNIANNYLGIIISYSSNNVLRNNQLNGNTRSIYVTYSPLGQDISSFVNDIDTSNTVDGKPVYYWVNQQNKAVPPDAGYVGLISCTNIQVQNLNLTGNSQGVLLVSTTYSTITKNNITNNSGYGIHLHKSSNNYISENIITNNDNNGIYLYQSSNNIFSENTITANNQDGVHLLDSSHNSITGNTIRLNNEGVHIYSGGSTNNSIVGNTITENNEYGVSLDWANNDNFVTENYIVENGMGVFVKESSNNRIIGNTIQGNNGWAIRLEGGQRDNLIYHNYLIDNNVEEGFQVSIPGLWQPGVWEPGNPNVWDDGEKGNYWSDYFTRYSNATEIGTSGIGDTPFYINPNNIDQHPVVKDGVIPEFPTWAPMLITLVAVVAVMIIYRCNLNKHNQGRRVF